MTLLGGGQATLVDLNRALLSAPILVGIDGGADRALGWGHPPALVVGDLDSLTATARETLDPARLCHTPDQDSTDFDKTLNVLPDALLLCLGVAGARLDHTLATLNTLARNPHRRIVVIAGDDIVFLAPPRLQVDLPVGSRLSLFPMAPVTAQSAGLKWPLDGLDLMPGGRIGTSNRVTGPVDLRVGAPGLVVLLQRQTEGSGWRGETALQAALSVMAGESRWPTPDQRPDQTAGVG